MVDCKKVFEALPNVQTIWLTSDGHFHLHPNNGGEKVERDGAISENDDDINSDKSDKRKTVKEIVELLENAQTVDEVNSIVLDDERQGVKKAAEKRIAAINN